MSPPGKLLSAAAALSIVSLAMFAAIDLPKAGESALLQPVSSQLPIKSNSGVWDFSAVALSADPMEVLFSNRGDSCISATLPGIRHDFLLHGDTVLHTASETHFVRLSDTIPMVVSTPAARFAGSFASRGRAYHSEYIDAFGDMSLATLAHGTLILPTGDTLREVSLTRHISRRTVAVAVHSRPEASPDKADSLLTRTTVVHTWSSPYYCVPVARTSTVVDSIGEHQKGEPKLSAWICPPGNQPLRELFNRKREFKSYGSSESDFNVTQPLPGISVTAADGVISVSATADAQCSIGMILTDVIGRVFSSMPATDYRAGATVEWSCDNLPPGQYILYVNRDNSPPAAQKIILR